MGSPHFARMLARRHQSTVCKKIYDTRVHPSRITVAGVKRFSRVRQRPKIKLPREQPQIASKRGLEQHLLKSRELKFSISRPWLFPVRRSDESAAPIRHAVEAGVPDHALGTLGRGNALVPRAGTSSRDAAGKSTRDGPRKIEVPRMVIHRPRP